MKIDDLLRLVSVTLDPERYDLLVEMVEFDAHETPDLATEALTEALVEELFDADEVLAVGRIAKDLSEKLPFASNARAVLVATARMCEEAVRDSLVFLGGAPDEGDAESGPPRAPLLPVGDDGPRYQNDDEPGDLFSLAEFVEANEDLRDGSDEAEAEIDAIRHLGVGDFLVLGGGAAAEFVLRRVS